MRSRSKVVIALVAAALPGSWLNRAPAIQAGNEPDRFLVLSNQAVAGEVAETSPVFRTKFLDSTQRGRPVRSDCWILETKAAGWVQFEASSRDFDPYLVVKGTGGLLAEDDDSGLATNSRLRLSLPAGERLEVRVCGLHEGVGLYELIARPVPAEQPIVEPSLRSEIEEFERLVARDDPSGKGAAWRVGCLMELAGLYVQDNRLADAERVGRQALADATACFGVDDPTFAEGSLVLGRVLRLRHCLVEAEPLLERALAVWERSLGANDPHVADARMQLAMLYHARAEFGRAEALYRSVGEIYEDRVEPARRAALSNQLALLFRDQGRNAEAIPLLEGALAIRRRLHGRESREAAGTQQNLAAAHRGAGDLTTAERVLRELVELARTTFGKDSVTTIDAVANLAEVCLAQAQFDEAEELANEVLEHRKRSLGLDHPLTGLTQTILGAISHEQGDPERALQILDEAIGTLASADIGPRHLIRALRERSQVKRELGDVAGAWEDLESALREIEGVRPRATGGDWERGQSLAQYSEVFDLAVEIAFDDADLGRAFETIERARARTFLDQLSVAATDWRETIPPADRTRLLARERELESRLAELESADQQDSSALRVTQEAYRDCWIELRNASTAYRGALASVADIPRLNEAQREIAGSRSLIALYYVGDARSWLLAIPPEGTAPWAMELRVSQEAAQALEVAEGSVGAATVDRAVRALLDPVRSSGPGERGVAPVRESATADRGAFAASAAAALIVPEALRAAWRGAGVERLVLVVDGSMKELPLEIIAMSGGSQGTRYLLEDAPPVLYLPSLTGARALARRTTQERVRPPSRKVLTVGAPAFDATSLPGTAEESDIIVRLFGPEDTVQLKGTDATEARIRAELPGKRYVHFATHGVVDGGRGNFFGALLLANGGLTLADVYGLDLVGCELVTLSACETAVGSEVPADVALTLSRGFLVAGAERVVASLWRVDDRATRFEMEAFWQAIADAHRNANEVDPAYALRKAKLRLLRDPEWSHPYYWGSFILAGRP